MGCIRKYYYSASWDTRNAIVHIDHEDKLANTKPITLPDIKKYYKDSIISTIKVEDIPSKGSGFYYEPKHTIYSINILSNTKLEPYEIEKITIDKIKEYQNNKDKCKVL